MAAPLAEAAFVGVAERYAESLQRLGTRLGWQLPILTRNQNPDRTKLGASYELTQEEARLLREWNRRDLALYEEALRLTRADKLAG